MKKTISIGIALILIMTITAIAENEPIEYNPTQGEFNVQQGQIIDFTIGETILKGVNAGKVTNENNFDLTINTNNANVLIAGKTFSVISSGSRIINDNGIVSIISSSDIEYSGGVYDLNGKQMTVKADGSVDLPSGGTYARAADGVTITGPATIFPSQFRVELEQGATYANSNYGIEATATEGDLIIYEGDSIDDQSFISKSNFDNALKIERTEILASGKYKLEVGRIDFKGKGDQGVDYGDKGTQKIPLSDTTLKHYTSFSVYEKYSITNSDAAGVKYQVLRNEQGNVVAWIGAPGAAAKAAEGVSKKLGGTSKWVKVSLYRAFGTGIPDQKADEPPQILREFLQLTPTEYPDTWEDPEHHRWIYVDNPLVRPEKNHRWETIQFVITQDGWLDQNGKEYNRQKIRRQQ